MSKNHSENKFPNSSYFIPSQFDITSYLERTKRNHMWLGGRDEQLKLHRLKVGVAGLGGMGSNIAEILVRLGAGHIRIADPDIIEHSNLNRQVIANKNTVGMKKAAASANELRAIAHDFELVVYEDGITENNADEFVDGLDLIIDEIDVFPFSPHLALHRAARKRNLPLYSGYIIGMGTHVYKFHGNEYTFEDFLNNNPDEIANPSAEFMMNRLCNPLPKYMDNQESRESFANTIRNQAVPIFGATTFASQSLVAIRAITDYLKLDELWGGPKTPTMPNFIKFDPFEMTFNIFNINELPEYMRVSNPVIKKATGL